MFGCRLWQFSRQIIHITVSVCVLLAVCVYLCPAVIQANYQWSGFLNYNVCFHLCYVKVQQYCKLLGS